MRLMTATSAGQGEQPGDFCFTTEGELVLVGDVCAWDRADPDGGCGCGRAFAGMSSHRATTTAVVRDLPLSAEDLAAAVTGCYTGTGLGPDVLGDADFQELVTGTVEELVAIGRSVPVGTLVGRRLDRLLHRS